LTSKIFSPIVSGSGVEVIHRTLSEKIKNYQLSPISPIKAMLPFCLHAYHGDANIVHTLPDIGPKVFGRTHKNVVTFHGYSIDEGYIRQQDDWKRRLYYRHFLRKKVIESVTQADSVTCVSRFLADLVLKDIGPVANLEVIHNGVDVNHFRPINQNKKSDRPFRVLFIGKLIQRKGFNLIQSLAKHFEGQIEFWAVGAGEVKSKDQHALKIMPKINHQDMPHLFQQVDALLFPSTREGLSLVIAEAMACGLPVISSDIPSIRELMIHKKGGFLCEPNNDSQFISALKKLSKSPNNCADFGDFNRQRAVNNFNAEDMVKHYSDLFNQL